MSRRYYTLLCSLPHLPHFQKAKHLPLTPVMLEKRLGMLEKEERRLCDLILGSLPWHHAAACESVAEMEAAYRQLLEQTGAYPDLQKVFGQLMEQRVVIAWYRSRIFGIRLGSEYDGMDGFASLIKQLEKGKKMWLAHRFPWLKAIEHCLEADLPYELAVLLMELEWKEAKRLAFSHPFGFEEVASYLIRWMILQMRFGFDTLKAADRFVTLTSEIVSEYRHTHPLFD